MAAGVRRVAAFLAMAASALGAQGVGERVIVGVSGTRLNRLEVWVDAPALIGLTLVRNDSSVACGAVREEMLAWADSLERFSERLRGLSAVDTATLVSAAIPGCDIVGIGLGVGFGRSYALRHTGEGGVVTQVAVTAGTMRRVAADVRSAAVLVDSATKVVARALGVSPTDPRFRSPAPPGTPPAIYFDFQVDREVRPAAGSGAPRYPESLRTAGIEGEVLVRFVVDTSGLVILDSFGVLRFTQLEFVDAVRAALPSLLYVPAIKDGRNVRQMVTQPFIFKLERDE